jgi:hypothetical protein
MRTKNKTSVRIDRDTGADAFPGLPPSRRFGLRSRRAPKALAASAWPSNLPQHLPKQVVNCSQYVRGTTAATERVTPNPLSPFGSTTPLTGLIFDGLRLRCTHRCSVRSGLNITGALTVRSLGLLPCRRAHPCRRPRPQHHQIVAPPGAGRVRFSQGYMVRSVTPKASLTVNPRVSSLPTGAAERTVSL